MIKNSKALFNNAILICQNTMCELLLFSQLSPFEEKKKKDQPGDTFQPLYNQGKQNKTASCYTDIIFDHIKHPTGYYFDVSDCWETKE